MKIVKIVKNYLPYSECDLLNAWLLNSMTNSELFVNREKGLRFSARNRKTYDFLELANTIYTKIQKDFNVDYEPCNEKFVEKIAVSVLFEGGSVFAHSDPRHFDRGVPFKEEDKAIELLRCNILTAAPAVGGDIIVNKKKFSLEKGDMMQYLVTRHQHKVETVDAVEDKARIMWQFGWLVNGDKWEASIQ